MTDECKKCSEMDCEPCDDCKRKIHESWHEVGMWWIRPEMCSRECPGTKADLNKQRTEVNDDCT